MMSQSLKSMWSSVSRCLNWNQSLKSTMDLENYPIEAEVILPLVDKYFDRILPAQWSMLVAGSLDLATQVILADMCTEITQKLCADTIRLIIPDFKLRIQTAGKRRMKLKVEGGLCSAFALALHVPEQPCINAQKLDSLFKKEISQRVNHTMSTAINADGQLVPLLYIPGTFAKIEVLAKMVLLACGALKVYLSKMSTDMQCFRPGWWQQKSQKSLHGAKSGNVCVLNRDKTREAVINILRKWTDSEDESLSLRMTREVEKTAALVVETIINLHYSDRTEGGRSCSAMPFFNLGLIKDQLREFFECCVSPASSIESSRKRNFLNFCRRTLETLMSDLQKVRCCCMRMCCETEISLPSSVLQPLKPDFDHLFSLQGIQSLVEEVFHKVPVPVDDAGVDVDRLRHEADRLTQEMKDRIFRYLATNRTTVQSAEVWKRFSGLLIMDVDGKKPENIQILHKIVEDTATKFVQQHLLWLKMEPMTRGNHTDEVNGCLNDIDTLITGTMVPNTISLPSLQDIWPKTPPANNESSKKGSLTPRYAWASSHQPTSVQEMVTNVPKRTQTLQEFVDLEDI